MLTLERRYSFALSVTRYITPENVELILALVEHFPR